MQLLVLLFVVLWLHPPNWLYIRRKCFVPRCLCAWVWTRFKS